MKILPYQMLHRIEVGRVLRLPLPGPLQRRLEVLVDERYCYLNRAELEDTGSDLELTLMRTDEVPRDAPYQVPFGQAWCMDLTSSPEAWLAALPYDQRTNRRKFEQAGGVARVIEDDWSALAARVHALYLTVVKRRGASARFGEQDFAVMGRDPRFWLATAELDGALVACQVLWRAGDALYANIGGHDDDLSRKSRAYFATFYALVSHALARRPELRALSLGFTTDDFKRRLGCAPIAMSLVARPRSIAMRALLAGLDRFADIRAEDGQFRVSWRAS